MVLVYDGAGSLTHRYLHGPGYDQALADEAFASGDLFWLLDDNQGTVRDMADYDAATDTTTVANHIEYDSFGAILAQSDPGVEVFYAYTGQEWDADSGLTYYGGRWYSPTMRRFISADPMGFSAGDTNLARYVGNSPTNFIDPTGLYWSPSGDSWTWVLGIDDPGIREALATVPRSPEVGFWDGFTEDPLGWAYGPQGRIFNAAEHSLASSLGQDVFHPAASAAADLIDPIIPDQFTISYGGSLDVQVLIIHFSASIDVHLGDSNQDGVTAGLSGGGGGGFGLGLGANASQHVTITNAPNVGSLVGDQYAAGVNAGPVGVYGVDGHNYDGLGVSWGPGFGGGVWGDAQASGGWYTGPDAPPGPPPRPRPSGDGRQWLNPGP